VTVENDVLIQALNP